MVDRSDGMSRDLYASREAIEALKRDPRLKEFPVGVLFVLDVYSARLMARDPKTRAPRFEVTPQVHLMQKIHTGLRQSELGVQRLRPGHRRAIEAPPARRLPPVPSGGGGERHGVLDETAEALCGKRCGAIQFLSATRATIVSVPMTVPFVFETMSTQSPMYAGGGRSRPDGWSTQ